MSEPTFHLIDEWQGAVLDFDCDQRSDLRAALIGYLAAKLAEIPGGPELFREGIDTAIRYVVTT